MSDLARIMALAPEAVSVHALLREGEVVLRFHGLPFARWKDGRIFYWRRSAWRELGPRNEQGLQQLILDLKTVRNPLASDLRHSLYRAYAERWMQAMVMKDVSQVDVSLDPEHVYEQVIVESGGHHGVLDLLAVTRTKRLAIIELKATENPELPLQAADYWERIRRHQVLGDLERYGYFPRMNCKAPRPSSIWLLLRCASTPQQM